MSGNGRRTRGEIAWRMPHGSQLYDSDFYAWSREQAELLRAGKVAQADIEHIAEEIDSIGRTEKRAH